MGRITDSKHPTLLILYPQKKIAIFFGCITIMCTLHSPLKSCQHICCKEWYERAAKSCGFFIATKGDNPPNSEDMGSEILRNENTSKRQKENEKCSFESPVKRSKHSCMLSLKRPSKQSSHRSLRAKGKKMESIKVQ